MTDLELRIRRRRVRQPEGADELHPPRNITGAKTGLAIPPKTVVVVHPHERRSKCTVRALRTREDFAFCKFPNMPYDLSGYVRLGLGGPVLTEKDADSGLLVLDGTWRRVGPMERAFASAPIRTLPPIKTAYPRTSKLSIDPDGGLATIEAIYAAYRILGRETDGLLDQYHWAGEFLVTLNLSTPPNDL